jgi:predicted DNA-binding transcriptional regulator YafY
MENNRPARIRLIKLWEILNTETDEDHRIGTNALLERLEKENIECTRKTLYGDIDTLNELGYEVLCKRRVGNEYYVVDRKFDLAEIRILLDAVQAATFVTDKKTKLLVDKIASLAGSNRAQILKHNVVKFNTRKKDNEKIFYNVNEISCAIAEGKKITFKYFKYNYNHERVYQKNSALYCVSPIATVFDDDNYYLVCRHDNHEGVTHYRVDRMDAVNVTDADIDDTAAQVFDVAEHKNEIFGMFTGEKVEATFAFSPSLIDVVFDKFGAVNTERQGRDLIFSATIQTSPQFYAWCCGFGTDFRVIAPKSLVASLKDYTSSLRKMYSHELKHGDSD